MNSVIQITNLIMDYLINKTLALSLIIIIQKNK
jgi:hypothetical protein